MMELVDRIYALLSNLDLAQANLTPFPLPPFPPSVEDAYDT